MRVLRKVAEAIPGVRQIVLAVLSALMLASAFPGFELWYVAWFALVPFLTAVWLQRSSPARAFVLGWLFGVCFFFATVWWLTFAPIRYAGFPPLLAYLLLFSASSAVALFPAAFALGLSFLLRTRGVYAILLAPVLWTAADFARLWITGNNWNSIGYSQAFHPALIRPAAFGGVFLVGFLVVLINGLAAFVLVRALSGGSGRRFSARSLAISVAVLAVTVTVVFSPGYEGSASRENVKPSAFVVAIQPNVPMSGLDDLKWFRLRQRQIALAGTAIRKLREKEHPDERPLPIIVVLPESPMNYSYALDREFRHFIGEFARDDSVSVLFNSAEPDPSRRGGLFNSAVMINSAGKKVAQYDKIYLLPFGEFVPLPGFAAELIPPMVGRFSKGSEYDVLPLGNARAGVMICFESHFGSLGREYARRGADVIIEMTNDGYLGNTPVLRQHLANAVFRAVETGRPVLRATNVGITAYIDLAGNIRDPAPGYVEATRVWTVTRSSGNETIYVRFGEWFALLCLLAAAVALSVALLELRSGRFRGKRRE